MCVLGGEEVKVIYQLNENQIKQLHTLYQQEWWTKERSLEEAQKVVRHSQIVIAMVDDNKNLVAFARVLTDFTIKALVFDLIVACGYRSKGLGETLLSCVLNHRDLQNIKHFELYCLPEMVQYYKKFGFETLQDLKCMRMESDKQLDHSV